MTEIEAVNFVRDHAEKARLQLQEKSDKIQAVADEVLKERNELAAQLTELNTRLDKLKGSPTSSAKCAPTKADPNRSALSKSAPKKAATMVATPTRSASAKSAPTKALWPAGGFFPVRFSIAPAIGSAMLINCRRIRWENIFPSVV